MRQQLLLGTAQWGLDYGITNAGGRILDGELTNVVATARRLGIRALDTATVYGDAHSRITQFAPDFMVQTKVSAAGKNESEIRRDIDASMRNLQVDRIWRILVHDWPELKGQERSLVIKVLADLRESGVLTHFGVSIYTEFELTAIESHFGEVRVVQVPASIVDQRLSQSEVLHTLRKAGVAIQARSIFLQGALLDSRSSRATHPELVKFFAQVREQPVDAVDVCVNFIKAQEWIDEVVFGATSAREVLQICNSFSGEQLDLKWESWASGDDRLLDPRRWPRF